MTFSDFIEKNNRKQIKNSFPDFFVSFQNDLSKLTLQAREENDTIIFEFFNNKELKKTLLLNDYLDSILGNNIQKINDRIITHFESENIFFEGLPLFIIRRHGTHSGAAGSIRRRRGWLVKFNNAWIVYADNFFPRHFFESAYFVDSGNDSEISLLNQNLEMPYSSGGGKFESKHRVFPSLTHFTSKSNIYLSHLHDLNQGNYILSENAVSAKTILGNSSDGKFGSGFIENWDNGKQIKGEKNCRIIDIELTKDEIDFLKAYNVRMLSPFNYFPFAKTQHLGYDSMNGECHLLRSFVEKYLEIKYKDSYNNFRQAARIKN